MVVVSSNESQQFKLETDSSDIALAAILNQNGRPFAFFSRASFGSELKHLYIEKEASAINLSTVPETIPKLTIVEFNSANGLHFTKCIRP